MPREHVWYKCAQPCYRPSCPYCDGGLGTCVVCGSSEGELTTECPGQKVSSAVRALVYAGRMDFRGGRWVRLPGVAQRV